MTEILMKFNNYLMELSATNENIEISEHWLNCMADLSNIQNGDVTKINNTLVRFDRYISNVVKTPTDEHIAIYEHWIDCMGDIQDIISTRK